MHGLANTLKVLFPAKYKLICVFLHAIHGWLEVVLPHAAFSQVALNT